MKKFCVLLGSVAWTTLTAGMALAADNKKPPNQPAVQTPAPAPQPQPRRQMVPPPQTDRSQAPNNPGSNNPRLRALELQRAAAADAAAVAARNAAANQQRSSEPQRAYDRSSYPGYRDYRSDYSPYYSGNYGNYSPYSYVPYGTTPYVLGLGSNGQAYLYPYTGGYSNYSPYSNPYYSSYGSGYSYSGYPYVITPPMVFAPAGQLYGLGPIQQLMGVDQWFNPRPANGGNFNGNFQGNARANPNPGLAQADANANGHLRRDGEPAEPKAANRAAGGKAMELAWKFISFGDAHFGNQKFSDALERYRRATRECPKLADGWFRQGFALAAQGKYEQAAKAMRRGLEEKPDWASTNFRLDEIYRDSAADKKDHIDEMVKASEAAPTNGDVAFIVGVHLYCDGKADQAAAYFRRAAQISGNDAEVKSFLADNP